MLFRLHRSPLNENVVLTKVFFTVSRRSKKFWFKCDIISMLNLRLKCFKLEYKKIIWLFDSFSIVYNCAFVFFVLYFISYIIQRKREREEREGERDREIYILRVFAMCTCFLF